MARARKTVGHRTAPPTANIESSIAVTSTTSASMTNQPTALDDQFVIEALTHALVPAELAPERRSALRDRILARAEATTSQATANIAGSGFVTIAKDEGQWQTLHPGVTMKFLHDHGDAQSFLLRLEAGASIPMHSHEGDELCVVLEGSVLLNEVEGRAGTFHLALPGSGHQTVTSDTGCLLYLRANLDTGVRFAA